MQLKYKYNNMTQLVPCNTTDLVNDHLCCIVMRGDGILFKITFSQDMTVSDVTEIFDIELNMTY